MGILTLEQISNADDLPTKTIDVPAWGGEVVIRALTKQQQHDVRQFAQINEVGDVDDTKLELGLLTEAIIQPALTRDNIAILQGKNATVVDDLLGEVFRLSALDGEAVARKRLEFQEESVVVDGVPSGGQVEDDGEAAAPDDAD